MSPIQCVRSVLFLCAALVAPPSVATVRAKIEPMAGQDQKIVVKRSDTLYRIARRYDMSMSDLVRANGRKALRLRAGETLVIPVRRILPANPPDGIVLNIPARRIYLFKGGQLAQMHAVAVGKPDWQTALGQYHVVAKVKDPTWRPPVSMVQKEGVKDDPVPPGPENPLGDRWIGWSARGFGFHSTNSPVSIGGVVSHGCVRLYPEQAEALFDAIRVGTPIYSVYEPVLVGRDGGSYYLSVWPDVYHKGGTSEEDVEQILREAGLLGAVDLKTVHHIARRAQGIPQRIIGSDLRLEVNGKAVELPVAPTSVDGRLVVPARQTVEALGGTLTNQADGSVKIVAGSKTLVLTGDKPEADLDGVTTPLPFVPTVVGDTLVVSLRTLLDLFGASFSREGDVLKISADVHSSTGLRTYADAPGRF